MFWIKHIKENRYTPVNPSFARQKWGIRGLTFHGHVNVMFIYLFIYFFLSFILLSFYSFRARLCSYSDNFMENIPKQNIPKLKFASQLGLRIVIYCERRRNVRVLSQKKTKCYLKITTML